MTIQFERRTDRPDALTHLTGFEKTLRRKLLLADYDLAMHDKFLAYLRQKRQLAQNAEYSMQVGQACEGLFALHAE